ncbi:MAG: hypothetical protein ACRDZY_04490, partial [Acidimicrobiales bacterium]
FVVVAVGGWMASGNPVLDLVTWLEGSAQVTAGYSSAMGLDVPSLAGDYWRAPVVAAVVLGLAAWEMRRLPVARRIGVGLLALATLAASFKEGFVRHNLHSLIYFGVAAGSAAGLRSHRGAPRATLALGAGVVVVALLGLDTAGWVPRTNVDPVAGVEGLAHQASVLASPQRTAVTQAVARQAMRQHYHLDQASLALLEGRTVWIVPWEESLAWAYPSVRWDPPPVFQTYAAYTPGLDRIDAAYLNSSSAPARVLRHPALALDGRYPPFSPPLTQVALMCNYAQSRATSHWQVLSRVPARCGPSQPLQTVRTGWGQWVQVPAAPAKNEAVVAAWSPLPEPLTAKVEGVVLRPPVVDVQIRSAASPASSSYRFIPATAPDQHLVAPPADLGWTGPYLPPTIKSMRLTGGGMGPSRSGVTVRFYAVPVYPASPAPGG